jgi:hypothetical protein
MPNVTTHITVRFRASRSVFFYPSGALSELKWCNRISKNINISELYDNSIEKRTAYDT